MFRRHYASVSNQKSAAAYSWKLLLNECLHFLNILYKCQCHEDAQHLTSVYIQHFRLQGSSGAATVYIVLYVCTRWQDSSNYFLSWAASSWRCVAVSTVLKLFSEVQPLHVDDQNKTWLVMPLRECCSVQLYSCTDSEVSARFKLSRKKNKELKRGTSEAAQLHSDAGGGPAAPLTAILVPVTGGASAWNGGPRGAGRHHGRDSVKRWQFDDGALSSVNYDEWNASDSD